MKKIIVLFTVISLSVHALAATPKAAYSNRWNQSIINFDFYKKLMTTENCEANVQKFAGCIISLNLIANLVFANGDENTSYIPAGMDPLSEYNVVSEGKKFGYLQFTEVSLKSITSIDLAKLNAIKVEDLIVEKVKRLRLAYQKFYEQAKASKDKPFAEIIKAFETSTNPKISASVLGGAINQYLETAIDPHTSLVPEKTFIEKMTQKGEEKIGAGFIFRPTTSGTELKGLTIVKVFDGTPAKKARMKKGDLITQVNGVQISNETINKVMNTVTDQKVKQIIFKVERFGMEYEFAIEKESYELENISEETLQFGGKIIGYVQLRLFRTAQKENGMMEDCYDLVYAFERLERNADGAILDLRDNPGGSIDAATCIASIFLGGGVRVATAQFINLDFFLKELLEKIPAVPMMGFSTSPTQYYDTPKINFRFTKPLIVLVNGGSASSSEMLAAALRDHNRAYIVGTRTFGKGTTMAPAGRTTEKDLEVTKDVLEKNPFAKIPENRLILMGTNYRFYSPKGLSHHGEGLVPHIISYLGVTPNPMELVRQREADRFLFPLGPETLKASPLANANMMNRLMPFTTCISMAHLPSYYEKLEDSDDLKDMQVLTGAQQIICGYEAASANRAAQKP